MLLPSRQTVPGRKPYPALKLLEKDPYLRPFAEALGRRASRVDDIEARLTSGRMSISEFASGHAYFGLHRDRNGWVFREWAPHATAVHLLGTMTGWREDPEFALSRIGGEGVWELCIPFDRMRHGDLYRLRVRWPSGEGERIPSYARRVVQDSGTVFFNAQVWAPPETYAWRHPAFKVPPGPRFVYEAHVGMAQEEGRVGTYREFAEKMIPRIAAAGYNTVQLMAIQEHPFYGSFGYQVTSFFAASSRFGTPEELKSLVDAAHGAGLAVIIDLVHSHAARNEVEGLSRFDGSLHQFFHDGGRGFHSLWDSRCFDYGKIGVLHFLLSNCRYWLDEYRFDGFRFDGITSMLYLHHGIGKAFTSYAGYFEEGVVDEDALAYLTLANKVIHAVRPDAITIAEDISGMPGLAAPLSEGGCGFDYRFAMGISDMWTRLVKEVPDEHWPIGHIWHELTNRRREERTISYAESHDQALVGDQTLIFRLIGAGMYDHMRTGDNDVRVDRGIALHKMIRLITLATAGNGYLTFMGNEFGHPEWIDFPREGNNWSYHYARRQWRLADDPALRYRFLARFDQDMVALARRFRLLESADLRLVHEHYDDKVIAFRRAGLLFVFNFDPARSYSGYGLRAGPRGHRLILDSDAPEYGGHGRLVSGYAHIPEPGGGDPILRLYLPTRTALVLAPIEEMAEAEAA